MKKILLGTTALVAAGAFVGAAQADEMMAEPISVGVGGYYHTGLVITADDDDSDRGHALQQNIELEVAGSTTLDNGISVGVRIRVIGNNFGAGATNNTDETEVILSGAFGSIHYGTVEGAAQLMSLWAPGGSPHGGVKSAWFGTSVPWGTASMDEDALKISYYSPAFNGLSFGVSYAPEDSTDSYAGSAVGEEGAFGEGMQSAIGYTVDVMGGSFSANVGYETYTSEDNSGDAAVTRFGATLSIDQISVGGAVQARDANNTGGEATISDVGIGWSQGPLSLAVAYGASEGASDTVITALGAGYNLGPGIDFGAKLSMIEKGGADSSELLLGTTINF